MRRVFEKIDPATRFDWWFVGFGWAELPQVLGRILERLHVKQDLEAACGHHQQLSGLDV